jgi:hypothetical protein
VRPPTELRLPELRERCPYVLPAQCAGDPVLVLDADELVAVGTGGSDEHPALVGDPEADALCSESSSEKPWMVVRS